MINCPVVTRSDAAPEVVDLVPSSTARIAAVPHFKSVTLKVLFAHTEFDTNSTLSTRHSDTMEPMAAVFPPERSKPGPAGSYEDLVARQLLVREVGRLVIQEQLSERAIAAQGSASHDRR